MPRIPYANPADMTPETKAAVDKAPINVMRMLAGTSPAVFEAYGKYAAAFFAPGGLLPDLRELAIVRAVACGPKRPTGMRPSRAR